MELTVSLSLQSLNTRVTVLNTFADPRGLGHFPGINGESYHRGTSMFILRKQTKTSNFRVRPRDFEHDEAEGVVVGKT